METSEKLKIMSETKQTIIDYLTDEIEINSSALKSYHNPDDHITNSRIDSDVERFRQMEAVKLRDRIQELSRHISVIKRIIV